MPIPWKPLYNFPPGMAESATMFGDIHAPGQYFVLIRWRPGYMSAPHWYETDRLCVVVSGTWYVASGEDFAPDATVAVPAGSFVHRVAKTPHYDGVKKGAPGARDHRDLRHRADHVPPDRSHEAGLAGSRSLPPAPPLRCSARQAARRSRTAPLSRRSDTQPSPANPISIIAHVEDSGALAPGWNVAVMFVLGKSKGPDAEEVPVGTMPSASTRRR